MEVFVSVCVRELVVCVVVFACYVCMCLVSRAFTEPLESSERHDTHTHTLMQLHTDIQKHTDICRCKRAHAFWARARTGPF